MITVATDEDTFSIDGDLSMTLEDLQAILEADSGIPPTSQEIFCNGTLLSNRSESLSSLGVQQNDLLLLRKKEDQRDRSAAEQAGGSSRNRPGGGEDEMEILRQEMLGNAQLMSQLRASRPDLAEAITSRPQQFFEMLKAERQNNAAAQLAQAQLAAADEFDIEAQKRIEEAIRQEAVMENFGSAMEFNPESFGRVTMLYVETQVNGYPVKAFVDSGAQATIMSPECAEKCGIMRLIDTRFAGIARGVGTAKILGRVHSAQIKLGDELFLPCSFTIMEGRTTELLFGLDMLKRHACVLDMAKNALIVHGKSIRFLDEHELPASARMEGEEEDPAQSSSSNASDGVSGHGIDTANANAAAKQGAGQSFPGSGKTLSESTASSSETTGSGRTNAGFTGMSWNHSPSQQAPRAIHATSTQPTASSINSRSPNTQPWPAASLQALKDLGATESQAKALLDASRGNVEVAASLLFQQ